MKSPLWGDHTIRQSVDSCLLFVVTLTQRWTRNMVVNPPVQPCFSRRYQRRPLLRLFSRLRGLAGGRRARGRGCTRASGATWSDGASSSRAARGRTASSTAARYWMPCVCPPPPQSDSHTHPHTGELGAAGLGRRRPPSAGRRNARSRLEGGSKSLMYARPARGYPFPADTLQNQPSSLVLRVPKRTIAPPQTRTSAPCGCGVGAIPEVFHWGGGSVLVPE